MKIRKALNLFANLRPAYLYPELAGACPLKEEISKAGFDIMIIESLPAVFTSAKERPMRKTESERRSILLHTMKTKSEELP